MIPIGVLGRQEELEFPTSSLYRLYFVHIFGIHPHIFIHPFICGANGSYSDVQPSYETQSGQKTLHHEQHIVNPSHRTLEHKFSSRKAARTSRI